MSSAVPRTRSPQPSATQRAWGASTRSSYAPQSSAVVIATADPGRITSRRCRNLRLAFASASTRSQRTARSDADAGDRPWSNSVDTVRSRCTGSASAWSRVSWSIRARWSNGDVSEAAIKVAFKTGNPTA